jgi:hypothetical protein
MQPDPTLTPRMSLMRVETMKGINSGLRFDARSARTTTLFTSSLLLCVRFQEPSKHPERILCRDGGQTHISREKA